MALGVTVVSATSVAGNASYGQPAQLASKGGGGWLRVRVATLSGDNAYPVGGYPVTASTFLLGTQIIAMDEVATFGAITLTGKYDATNSTWRLYTGTAELAASATDGYLVRVMLLGW